jgi:hypothetical protein
VIAKELHPDFCMGGDLESWCEQNASSGYGRKSRRLRSRDSVAGINRQHISPNWHNGDRQAACGRRPDLYRRLGLRLVSPKLAPHASRLLPIPMSSSGSPRIGVLGFKDPRDREIERRMRDYMAGRTTKF